MTRRFTDNTEYTAETAAEDDIIPFTDVSEGTDGKITMAELAKLAKESQSLALSSEVETEASARQTADTALQGNIDSEASARSAADSTLQTNIDTEATARANADTALQTSIDTEIADRKTAVSSEASARESADGTLQSSIDALYEETTHADLLAKVTAGTLTPGALYRITDYECTTTQAETQSAGHVFDIIVRALDASHLDENARAVQHDGDTYFASSKLSAWKLKYSVQNNTDRFAWASSSGKGVIYGMTDEFGNSCPYDFKNIQFKRFKVTATTKTATDLVGYYYGCRAVNSSSLYPPSSTISTTDTAFRYTFDYNSGAGDYSLNTWYSGSNGEYGKYCHSNEIKPLWTASVYNGSGTASVSMRKQVLNNIVFLNTSASSNNYGNKFGSGCGYNTFGSYCYYNTFGSDCYSNTFGSYCYYNTFGSGCYSNTFGSDCYSNTFGSGCGYNTFGRSCYSNTFGSGCGYNTFGSYCYYNTFGSSCGYNTFGSYCYYNTFGSDCYSNTFGSDCYSNTFGRSCYSNTFGSSCGYNTLDAGYQSNDDDCMTSVPDGTRNAKSFLKWTYEQDSSNTSLYTFYLQNDGAAAVDVSGEYFIGKYSDKDTESNAQTLSATVPAGGRYELGSFDESDSGDVDGDGYFYVNVSYSKLGKTITLSGYYD